MSKIITPLAKLSYPHFAEPQPGGSGKKDKYSGSFVFTPELLKESIGGVSGAQALAAMEQAAIDVLREKFGERVGAAKVPVAEAFSAGIYRSPFRRDWASKGYPEGSVFINARTERQPGLVYAHRDPTTGKPARVAQADIEEVFYPGAIVLASVAPFYYDTDGNKGVSFALNNVQKVRDADRLDSRVAADDEFSALLNEAPADLSSLQ